MVSHQYAGLRYYVVQVEFDDDADTDIVVVAETTEHAIAVAKGLFKQPTKPMLESRRKGAWKKGRITKVAYDGVIDG
jgi:hypothetical protein